MSQTEAGEKIGRARFAVYGHSVYPDATFTLRLSYGQVKGYPMNGTIAPPKTTLFGLYDRGQSSTSSHHSSCRAGTVIDEPSLDLVDADELRHDQRHHRRKLRIAGRQPRGRVRGLIFDGNIESLVGRFVYSEESNRAVAVHSAVIIEALRKLYDAGSMADELQGR